MSTSKLLAIGFKDEAQWVTDEKKLKHLGDNQNSWKNLIKVPRALYAFCEGNNINYIGKTTKSIASRFVGYCNPGNGLATNCKCHENIKKLLSDGKVVRILVFVDDSHFCWGPHRISIAAGLEDALVSDFNPPWNGSNKGVKTESEILEDEARYLESPGVGNFPPSDKPIIFVVRGPKGYWKLCDSPAAKQNKHGVIEKNGTLNAKQGELQIVTKNSNFKQSTNGATCGMGGSGYAGWVKFPCFSDALQFLSANYCLVIIK